MSTDPLSVAEHRVLAELATDGPANKVLAARLFVTERTVKWHLRNAMLKTGTTTRVGLVLWWVRRGQYEEPVRYTRRVAA